MEMIRSLHAIQETQIRSLGCEDPQEKEMANYSSILAWKIPWMEEPCRLQSLVLQRPIPYMKPYIFNFLSFTNIQGWLFTNAACHLTLKKMKDTKNPLNHYFLTNNTFPMIAKGKPWAIPKQQQSVCTSSFIPDSSPISSQLRESTSDICFQFYGVQVLSFSKELILGCSSCLLCLGLSKTHPVPIFESQTWTLLGASQGNRRPQEEDILTLGSVKVTQSCPALCDPMGCTVHGILQVRILEWVAFHFRGSYQLRDQTQFSRIASKFFTSWATREALIHR